MIRGVAKRTGFKEGVIEGILMELKDDVLQYLGEGYRVELGENPNISLIGVKLNCKLGRQRVKCQ